VAAGLNIRGLGVGKWLHNLGAVGMWGPLSCCSASAPSRCSASDPPPVYAEAMVPSTRLKDIVFWSTIAFSLSGLESASMMGDEIEDPRRNIPRALLLAGGLITGLYILATAAMLVALPPGEILNLQGFMQSIATASERVGLGWVTVLAGALLVAGGLGQAGAWFAPQAGSRSWRGSTDFSRRCSGGSTPLPFALCEPGLQAAIAAVFIFLGQAGTTVKGAYGVLVSMSIISYFIPYLFMFAAMIRLQWEPAGPGSCGSGRHPVAITLAALGFCTTAGSIGLAMVPAEDEPDKLLAVTKVVGLTLLLVLVGAGVYLAGRRRAHRATV
jgi:amino acid transporter